MIEERKERWAHGRDDWYWSRTLSCWISDKTGYQSYYCLGDRMFHEAFGAKPDEEWYHGSYTGNWHGGIQTNSFKEALDWLHKAKGTGHDLW